MANPWEKYQQQEAAPVGPWMKYSEPAAPKPPAPELGMFSRFYDNAVAPTVDLVKDIAKRGGPAAIADMAGGIADRFIEGFDKSKSVGPFGPIGEGIYAATYGPQADTAVEDVGEGRYGAAAGGLAGMAAPFLVPKIPAVARTVAKTDMAALKAGAKGAVKGGANAAVTEAGRTLRQTPTVGDALASGAGYLANGPAGAAGAVAAVRTAQSVPAVARGALAGIREELAKLKAERHLETNPGRTVEPVTAEALPDAAPISGDLPSGRRPLTAAEREAKYGKALPKPDNAATVSIKDEPAPVKMSTQEAEQGLADLFPDLAGREPKVKGPVIQHEAAARAKKVWNITDKLHENGWTTDNLHTITKDELLGTINELNGELLKEWKLGGAKGKKPNLHGEPSVETIQQIVKEMSEIEARKATEQ